MAGRRKYRSHGKKNSAPLPILIIAVIVFVAIYGLPKSDTDSDKTQDSTSSAVETATKSGTKSGDITVEYIDVGQGDSALISSGGKFMLIDTGDRDSDNTLIRHLQSDGVETIDYLVLSHPHADHIGEAAEIVQTFDIGTVIAPQVPDSLVPTTQIYESLLDAMDEKGLKFHAAREETFDFGDCTVQTWAASGDYDNLNNYSVILKLTDGAVSFLFDGDCEAQEETEILSSGADLSATVLKAAHHGSKTSSTSAWLEAVSPEYTVISCGAGNKYGHPDDDTYSRILSACPNTYVTMDCGTVTFTSNGETVTCTTERQ